MIAAVADNGAIGRDNALLWHIPADMKYFRTLTTGSAVIMGRKTFESIGRPLPKRCNIVISRSDSVADRVIVAHSLEEAFGLAAGRQDTPALSETSDTITIDVDTPVISEASKARAAELVSQMTLDEKLSYIGGIDGFYIREIPRLGIPRIRMADGPQGVRNDTKSTMYPCGIAAAATWNRDLAFAYGKSLGTDARARGVHIMLGPGVNIYRFPKCGRNFEYYGEDPYLTSETAVQYIKGMQSVGVMSTIKHFF